MLRKIFERLRLTNLTISLVKSEFCQPGITYLEHVARHGIVHPLNAKIEDIMRYPTPDNVKAYGDF